MIEKIWVSPAGNSAIVSKLTTNPDEDQDDYRSELERNEQIMKKHDLGITLSDEERPRRAHPYYRDENRIRKLADFFKINRYFVVSSAFAKVLREFDLGEGGLFPIDLYKGNRIARFPGEWYFLNFGCLKQVFIPEQSAGGFTQNPYRSDEFFHLNTLVKNGDITVSASALEGPDLWHDPRLHDALFLSGRLEAALTGAKLTRTLRRARCRIAEA